MQSLMFFYWIFAHSFRHHRFTIYLKKRNPELSEVFYLLHKQMYNNEFVLFQLLQSMIITVHNFQPFSLCSAEIWSSLERFVQVEFISRILAQPHLCISTLGSTASLHLNSQKFQVKYNLHQKPWVHPGISICCLVCFVWVEFFILE